jgi:hypothetical protein
MWFMIATPHCRSRLLAQVASFRPASVYVGRFGEDRLPSLIMGSAVLIQMGAQKGCFFLHIIPGTHK